MATFLLKKMFYGLTPGRNFRDYRIEKKGCLLTSLLIWWLLVGEIYTLTISSSFLEYDLSNPE